jgi:hypothetical protein
MRGFIISVREQEDNGLSSVKMRKPELYRASRRDSEEWPASPTSGDEEELVGESWFAHRFLKNLNKTQGLNF